MSPKIIALLAPVTPAGAHHEHHAKRVSDRDESNPYSTARGHFRGRRFLTAFRLRLSRKNVRKAAD